MKKFILPFLLNFCFVQTAFALLPPLYQSIDEMKAILISEELSKHLDSADLILSIQRNSNGYEITSNLHTLQVDIIYLPAEKPGPAKFDLKFHDALPVK